MGAAQQLNGLCRGHLRVRAGHLPRAAPASAAAAAATHSAGRFHRGFEPPDDLGATLVGRALLCLWPYDGWQRAGGTLAAWLGAPLPARRFFACCGVYWQTLALRGVAVSLLDATSSSTASDGRFSDWMCHESPSRPPGLASVQRRD